MSNQIDKYKQRQALNEKHKQLEIPTELIKIQDQYNKQNIKLQHELNLGIFKKQRRLTIFIAIITALLSFTGIILGILIERLWLDKPLGLQSKTSIIEPQDTTATQKAQEHQKGDTTKSAQGESSLKNLSKP